MFAFHPLQRPLSLEFNGELAEKSKEELQRGLSDELGSYIFRSEN